jgi:hypothetical protein
LGRPWITGIAFLGCAGGSQESALDVRRILTGVSAGHPDSNPETWSYEVSLSSFSMSSRSLLDNDLE